MLYPLNRFRKPRIGPNGMPIESDPLSQFVDDNSDLLPTGQTPEYLKQPGSSGQSFQPVRQDAQVIGLEGMQELQRKKLAQIPTYLPDTKNYQMEGPDQPRMNRYNAPTEIGGMGISFTDAKTGDDLTQGVPALKRNPAYLEAEQSAQSYLEPASTGTPRYRPVEDEEKIQRMKQEQENATMEAQIYSVAFNKSNNPQDGINAVKQWRAFKAESSPNIPGPSAQPQSTDQWVNSQSQRIQQSQKKQPIDRATFVRESISRKYAKDENEANAKYEDYLRSMNSGG